MADRYTGPAVIERFEAEGASVVPDTDSHRNPDGPATAIAAAGQVDVLIVNLIARWRPAPPTATTDERWLAMSDVVYRAMLADAAQNVVAVSDQAA